MRVKQFVSMGESTWTIPMTWSLFHRGAHIALRMPWKRMESPAPKRGSTMASEVRIETRSFMTRSVMVLETVILPSPLPPGLRCFTTMGTSLPTTSSASMRKPRSAGTWSKTISMTCCSTSSTGRTAISVSATLVRTFRIRLEFWISVTSGIFLRSATAAASGTSEGARSRESSPTLRMIVPASSERGLASSSTTFPSRAFEKVSRNLPRRILSPSLRGASMTGVPLTWVPFLDLRSVMRTPSSLTLIRAWVREIPKSLRTIWQSGDRPITTSPVVNVYVCGASPSW